MTPFLKASLTRALCAAAWCAPGAAWWMAPMLAAATPLGAIPYVSPAPPGTLLCGQSSAIFTFHRNLAWHVARQRPELVDTLIVIAESEPARRDSARETLEHTRQPRALRYLAARPPAYELPPLVVHPVP
jgi:hypothetical protein